MAQFYSLPVKANERLRCDVTMKTISFFIFLILSPWWRHYRGVTCQKYQNASSFLLRPFLINIFWVQKFKNQHFKARKLKKYTFLDTKMKKNQHFLAPNFEILNFRREICEFCTENYIFKKNHSKFKYQAFIHKFE